MFVDSPGKCIECGGPTSSGALQLCPKCSAKRHQCEHCLAALTAKDEMAAESVADTKPNDKDSMVIDSPPTTAPAWSVPDNAKKQATNESATGAPPPQDPNWLLPPPNPGPDTPRLKPIHPAKPGTYTSGKWRFQMEIANPGTRNEGRWGWLTYNGQKLPRGNVNDFYVTPWGPMYWVDVPSSAGGLHGFMPIPSPQNARQGHALALPARLVSVPPAPPAAYTPPAEAPAAAKVQTLEINRSQNGQLARLHVGNVLIVRLPGNPATGYEWEIGTTSTAAVRMTVRPQYAPPAATATGAPAWGTYTFVFQAVQAGKGSLRLYYVRPNDPARPRDSFAVGVAVSPAAAGNGPTAASSR